MLSKELTVLLGIPCLVGIVFLALLYCKVFRKYFTVLHSQHRSVDAEAEMPTRTYVINVGPGSSQGEELSRTHQDTSCADIMQSLTSFQYRELTTQTSSNTVVPTECAVCLALFAELDLILQLPLCGHVFHKVCMESWLLVHSSCPLCRQCILPINEA
ncbi:hypothetical protein KP509_05G024700 [Ceratopteris richardii]|uniref:RING-type domain-containing protein n=1 Tax=Ceratopteris richardii TaxID=49495 RepID=A0A8T2URW7_CERRI|nr:hypothetical protein KP509_05G024700 [Ceratopteris richardii]